MSIKAKSTRHQFTLILVVLSLSCINLAYGGDVLQQHGTNLDRQPQIVANAISSLSRSESFLEQVRVNARQQAAEAAFNLSIAAVDREDLQSANTLIQEALQLQPLNPKYLQAAAGIAYQSKEYNKAETYQMKTLEIVQVTLKPSDLRVAILLDNLGAIYMAQHRDQEAEELVRKSFMIREQSLGAMHPSLAAGLNVLAGIAMKNARFEEAEQLLKRVLHILNTSIGSDRSDTALAMHNLGDFYSSQKRFSEADNFYRQALAIWEKAPAKDRLELAAILNELGNYYRSQKRLDEAKPQFELVVTLLSEEFGVDHPYVSKAKAGLENLNADREKLDQVSNTSQRLFDELQSYFLEHSQIN